MKTLWCDWLVVRVCKVMDNAKDAGVFLRTRSANGMPILRRSLLALFISWNNICVSCPMLPIWKEDLCSYALGRLVICVCAEGQRRRTISGPFVSPVCGD